LAIERPRLCAVFDTNVVIAALKSRNPRSPTAELMTHWEAGKFDLLYSQDLRAEYARKTTERAVDPARSQAFLNQLDQSGIAVQVSEVEPLIEADPDDDKVIACAVAGGADYLVTYDPHFLPLGDEYHGVRIVDGLHFLYIVRGDTPPDQK
jgi:predicted nucleic acid-binding protein